MANVITLWFKAFLTVTLGLNDEKIKDQGSEDLS
jgi:hypothetical protein